MPQEPRFAMSTRGEAKVLDYEAQAASATGCPNGGFQKGGDPQNGLFTMENPIWMDDLGVPPILGNLQIS